MNNLNLVSYSFIIALVIVALILISKKLFNLHKNIESFKEVEQVEKNNLYDSYISESGSYPIKVLNPGEPQDYESQQEKISIEPQYNNNQNKIIDAVYDVLPETSEDGSTKNPFDKIDSLLDDKQIDETDNYKDNDYIYDLGEVNGSLRDVDSNYVCGKQQWPVGFDLNVNEKIGKNVEKGEYSRRSPYNSGMISQNYGSSGQKDYGFACVDKKINNWFYCRGGNACKPTNLKIKNEK